MSVSILIFGPSDHFWKGFKGKPLRWRVFYHKPDEINRGSIGFVVPFVRVSFDWE